MMENLHPNTRAMLETLTREQCEEILNTKYTASDIQSQIERLEEIEKQLCKPNSVTIEGYVARDKVGTNFFTTLEPTRASEYWKCADYIILPKNSFPEVTWESEPKCVRITLTLMEE